MDGMILMDVVAGVVMLAMSAVIALDSAPMKGALYVFARWRHRRWARRHMPSLFTRNSRPPRKATQD
ncbi:MAG TPA: hypothetical protein VGU22_02365 [Methylomirabilota bacterium]|jgi:hypothetical protein|nr:hypothetical protein [Methylomirabilota bacterium]